MVNLQQILEKYDMKEENKNEIDQMEKENEKKMKKICEIYKQGRIEEQTIKDTGEEVEVIYHMADIHIRKSTNRHEEYNGVFERLYKKIKNEKRKSIIVICGDILHEKCNYNEISLGVIFGFMEKLVNITDVIIIMGNHDGYTLRENKRDALLPILERIKGKNKLFYLKERGIYEYENLIFGVSSVCDNININSLFINSNKIKIALFHGSVFGSKMQNDFIIDKYDKTIQDFTGYDYVLLGDIHKHQYLTDRIAYPSSLIQQSHGEDLLDHGIIKWDLKRKTSEFIRIKNDYGFMTLMIDENKIVNIIDPNLIPKNIRLRIIYKNTSKSECKKLLDEYLINKKIESLIWHEDHVNKKKIYVDTLTNDLTDINDVNYQNKLINEYYREDKNMTEYFSEICKLNVELNKNIDTHATQYRTKNRGVKWEPLKLKFSNMFSYGPNNEIDFEKLNGIIGIIAPNHYGKSSILDIILFILYDKCSKSNIRSDIMNINYNDMYCELIFKVNGRKYKIVRSSRTKKQNVKSLRIEVDFYKEIDDKYICISGKDRNETNEIISEYVGSYDDLVMTHMSLQKDINFLDLSQSKRIDYLVKLLGIDVFEILHREAKKILNETVGVYKKLSTDFEKINDHETFNEQQKLLKKKKELKTLIQDKENIIEKMQIDVNNLFIKIIDVGEISENEIMAFNHNNIEKTFNDMLNKKKILETDANKLENILAEKEYTDEEINEINEKNKHFDQEKNEKLNEIEMQIMDKINNKKQIIEQNGNSEERILILNKKLEKKLENYKKEIEKQTNEMNEINFINIENEEVIDKNYDLYQNLKNEKMLKNQQLKTLIEKKEELILVSKKLINYEHDPNCKYCINNPFTKKAKKSKKELNDLNKLIDEIKVDQEKINNENIEKYNTEYKKLKNDKTTNERNQTRKNNLENSLKILEKDREITEMKLEKNKEKMKEIEKNKEIKKTNTIIDNDIKQLKSKMLNIKNEKYLPYIEMHKDISDCNKINNEICNIEDDIENINTNINVITKNKTRITQYKNNKIIHEEIIKTKKLINDERTEQDIYKKKQERVNLGLYQIEKILQERDEKLNELKKYEKKIEIYKRYTEITHRNGLSYRLLINILKNLEYKTNEILNSVTDFSVNIERIENKLVSGIEVYKQTETDNINILNCSGFEKFIINLAIRLAITNISNQTRTNWIAIDEGFSCMDANNLQNVESLLEKLRMKYDFILLISHLDELKSNCDKYINITKKHKNAPSYVKYT